VLWIRDAIGPWFDSAFNAKDFPNNSFSDPLVRRAIVNQFIDARNTLKETDRYRDEWANELHPTDTGFRKIAKVFNDVIQARM
jgi:hypothetical protein